MIRSDEIDVDGCQALRPDAIILSPGPRRPSDAGCSIEVVKRVDDSIPILGVCLGHQVIGEAFGGRIVRGDSVHGMPSEINHDGEFLFQGCPSPMKVGRYHSLVIDPDTLPSQLTVTAEGPDEVIMGIRHRERPIFGVQFHPESVLTDYGMDVLRNFVAIVEANKREPVT